VVSGRHPFLVMERHDDNALIVYTDGSCLQKPRRGGYAYRFVATNEAGDEVVHDFSAPGYLGATNNEMELTASIEALRHANGRHSPIARSTYEKIVIYTDSMYVLDHVYLAEVVWPTNGWMTREGEPVLSPDLWIELIRQKQLAGRVEFRRVQGHKTNPHNKAVDKLAKESAELANRQMLSARAGRRKTTPQKTAPRSVRMRGQIDVIKIIAVRDIRGQRHHAYKYEIIGDESPDFGAVDNAFAADGEVELAAGHHYEVRFAGPGRGRWIQEVLREIDRV
jgi:ribonuclease HI